jgi:hypothetical protein
MGKKTKEHRRRVEKRNRRINQEKYMMKKQIDKLFEGRLDDIKNESNLDVKLGDKNIPFSIVEDTGIFPNMSLNSELNNLDFTDNNEGNVVDFEIEQENEVDKTPEEK